MFRLNVAGLIRCQDQFVSCCRSDREVWQCAQGGIEARDESPLHALQRELKEELGLSENQYTVVYQSKFWRRYYFTKNILLKNRFGSKNIGQQQLWFFVELDDISKIQLKNSSQEFQKVDLFSLQRLLREYSIWKAPPLHDFCREINLISI